MRTITASEFRKLPFIFHNSKLEADYFEVLDVPKVGEDDEIFTTNEFTSSASGSVSVASDGIVVSAGWIASGGRESYSEAFNFDLDFQDVEYAEVEGAVITDDEGDNLSPREWWELIKEALLGLQNESIWDRVRKILPEPKPTEKLDGESEDMELWTVERDNDTSLEFNGVLLANTSSYSHKGPRNIRWTELKLYRTGGGKFVAAIEGYSRMDGERQKFAAKVCADHDEVKKFLGLGWLAKGLYDEAGIGYSDVID